MSKFTSRANNSIIKPWRANAHQIKDVPYEKMDARLLSYLDSLPDEIQKKIVVTSAMGDVHSKTSRHYSGAAFDLKIHNVKNAYEDDVFLHFMKDSENRKKLGITVLDPYHGNAPHIHISVGQGSENELDFAHGENWDYYIRQGKMPQSRLAWEQAMMNPVYLKNTATRFSNPNYAESALSGDFAHQEHEYNHEEYSPYFTPEYIDYAKQYTNEANREEFLKEYARIAELSNTPQQEQEEKLPTYLDAIKAKQDYRQRMSDFVNEYLTLDYEYTDYSQKEDGGYIEKYPNGGVLPQATAQDSIQLYNRALQFEKELERLGYKKEDTESFYSTNESNEIKGFETGSLKPTFSGNIIKKDDGWELNPTIPIVGSASRKDIKKHEIGKGHYFLKNLGGFKYEGNELLSPYALNTDLPKVYYDSRIKPQYRKVYAEKDRLSDRDVASFLTYDPIAVKPFDLLTEAQKRKRVEQYGTRGANPTWLRNNGYGDSINTTQGQITGNINPNQIQDSQLINVTEPKPYVPNLDTDLSAYLQSQGQPFDFKTRKAMAEQYGIKDYKGTAEQNLALLNLIKQGVQENAAQEDVIPQEQQDTQEYIVQEQQQEEIPTKPLGWIQIQGRNIPYYTPEDLEPFKKYNPTRLGNKNYVVSRFQEKTRGWTKDGQLLDENDNPIPLPQRRKYGGYVKKYPDGGGVKKSINEQFLEDFEYRPNEQPVNRRPIPLPEMGVTAEKPAIWKYQDELEANYPKFEGYENLKKILPERYEALKDSYESKKSGYMKEAMAAKILKDKPYNREEGMNKYLESLTDAEREIVVGSTVLDKQSKTFFDKIEQGLLSGIPMMPVKNPQYSQQEADDSTPMDAVEGVFGYAAKPLQVVANKLGVTDFKTADGQEYDWSKLLEGKQNDAGWFADLAFDLTNYVPISAIMKVSQLTKAGNFAEASKALNSALKGAEKTVVKQAPTERLSMINPQMPQANVSVSSKVKEFHEFKNMNLQQRADFIIQVDKTIKEKGSKIIEDLTSEEGKKDL